MRGAGGVGRRAARGVVAASVRAGALAVAVAVSFALGFAAAAGVARAQEGAGGAVPGLEGAAEQFFLIAADEGVLRVLQRTVVHNTGSEGVPRVPVPVPAGARLLEPEEGWDHVQPGPAGLVDGRPMAPGEVREYRVLYEFTMGSRPLALRRSLPYPVRDISFWVEEPALALTGLFLQQVGTETLADSSFTVYRMAPSPPTEAWQVVVRPRRGEGRALPDLGAGGDRHLDPLGALARGAVAWWPLLAVAVVALGGFAALRRRRGGADGSEGGDPEALLVRLEMAYRAGEVDDEVYAARRRRLMERALARRRRGSVEGG